jgi:hypothetical protein
MGKCSWLCKTLSNVVEDVVRVDFSETVVVMDLNGSMSLPGVLNAGGTVISAVFSEPGDTENSIPLAVGFDVDGSVAGVVPTPEVGCAGWEEVCVSVL